MTSVSDFLIAQPELTIFLTIAIGHAFGTLRLGDSSFGPIAGALFAGLIIGDFSVVPVSGMAKSFLFDLLLFGVGYSVGPQVLQALSHAKVDLPVAPRNRIERGGVLKFIGPKELLACTIARAGREVTPSRATDVVVPGLMIFLGGLVGSLIHEALAGFEILLGTRIGLLLAGLATGYLRSRFPLFGQSPDPAASQMTKQGARGLHRDGLAVGNAGPRPGAEIGGAFAAAAGLSGGGALWPFRAEEEASSAVRRAVGIADRDPGQRGGPVPGAEPLAGAGLRADLSDLAGAADALEQPDGGVLG